MEAIVRIPTIDDFQTVTLDEMDDAFNRAVDNRIAQEIEEARNAEK